MQCNRDSEVKSVKTLSLDAIHMRYPHPLRTTGDQAARANHGLLSKKKNLLSTQFFTKLDPYLCWFLQKRPETSVLPHRQQITDATDAAACNTDSSTTSTIPSNRFNSSSRDAVKCLVPTSAKLTDVSIFLDRTNSSVTKSLLQEQMT